jgi:DNA polymerase-4
VISPARIACLDLDTFFVSVERLLDPTLVGQPVVVGGVHGRGVVTSASYEVRAYGVKSGMPAAEARRLAPHAIFVPPRHGVYGDHAAKVRAILDTWCPEVRTASIDEFYLDFRGCENLYRRRGDADDDATIVRVIRAMREQIQADTGLPASVGIGTCRIIAKMASRHAKPANVRMVRAGEERAFVAVEPVRRFPGFGPVTEARLVEAGVLVLGDLLDGVGANWFPKHAEAVRRAVSGEPPPVLAADRPAFQEHDVEGNVGSISNERTFLDDQRDPHVVEAQLRALAERVCWRARQRGTRARTVSIKLRTSDFHTITRSRSIPPTNTEAVVAEVALQLANSYPRTLPVRLLGVRLSNLVGPDVQQPLPLGPAKKPVASALDAVRERFGYDAIRLGAIASRSEPG